eukprot:1305141-Alexandrium_andersonii.AAC.1
MCIRDRARSPCTKQPAVCGRGANWERSQSASPASRLPRHPERRGARNARDCLLYTSDAADDM